MFNETFYPTPRNLVLRMINDVDLRAISNCLEPSAGKGNIAEVVAGQMDIYNSKKDSKKTIDCIEIEPVLQSILMERGYRVVGDDFLKYKTYKHYDLILANVPFNKGDKHILSMIQIAEQNNGSKIRCLCNAETIKNPYSNNRKLLLQKIESYSGKIEFIENAFIDAERKTGVEVALIRLDIPSQENSIILNHLKKEEAINELEMNEKYEVGEKHDFIVAICKQYEAEVKATINLINEYNQISKISLKGFNEKDTTPILDLRISGDRSYFGNKDLLNNTIKEIRYKYWTAFLMSDNISSLMTSTIRTEWHEKLTELKEYDFSPFNARQVQHDVKMSLTKGIESEILQLFDEFTRFAMQDGTKNIHYFTGWKSNNAYKLGKKVVMPYMMGFCEYSGSAKLDYKTRDKLRDIEKVFTYIDQGVLQLDHVDLNNSIDLNFKYGNTKDIELKYFKIDFYKKGTAHIKFDDKYKDVLDRFNYIACNLKGWLPNSYGKKTYSEMNSEEQKITKEYCGSKEVYEKEVLIKSNLYEYNISNMKLLA